MKQVLLIVTLFFLSGGAIAQTQDIEADTPKEEIFTYVEQMPSFPGGEQAMYSYIKENLHYPEEAMEEGIEGRVYIKFIVSETGAIKNVECVKAADTSLKAEAIRLVSSMPQWVPGKQNGRAVNVYFTLPISFKLEHETEEKE